MKSLMLSTALASGFLSGAALAQTDNQRDEITVTAQRREQAPGDVGVALNAFAGEDLAAQGVDRVNGLEYLAPSLEIESQFGSGQPSFSIRGVGFRDYATNNAPTVGVYVDDVAYPIPVMTQGVIFDVDRVEVLRGPQGTLYGRNTTGGAIKVISAQPTDRLAAGMSVEAARFGRVDAEGFISGPLSQAVRVRLSGAVSQGGDWQINRETGEEIGAADQYALRGLIAVDVAPNVEALFNLHGFIDQSDGLGLQLFNDSSFGPLAHARRETSYGSSSEFSTLTGIDVGAHPFRDTEGWGASLTLNAGFPAADLTYIGAYEVLNRKEFNDFDALSIGAAGVYFETSADVMSHELRLSGATDRLHWVGGVYYAEEDLNELYQSDFVASFGAGFAVTTPYRQHVRTMAVFAHGEYALSEAISLVAGMRYEDETRRLRDLGTFGTGFGLLNFANGTTDGTLENRDLESGNLSGKIGVDIRPADDLLLYVSFSRGVKSGGFTAYNTLNPNALDPFRPEKLNAIEAGFKSNRGDLLQVNGAAFYYDYRDQQVQSAIYDPGTGAVVGRIVNAPKSEIYGGEIEAILSPAPWLTIGQTFAYKDGSFREFADLDIAATTLAGSAVTVDRAGQDLGFAKITYIGFAEATAPVWRDWSARLRFDYAYRDEVSLPLLGAAYAVPDYWLANARLAVGPDDGRWDISVWGRNIFNADYDETRNFFIAGGAADISAPGMPSTYGVRLSLRY